MPLATPQVVGPQSAAMTPTQVMSLLLKCGVDEESIVAWHQHLIDIPHYALLSWIESIRSGNPNNTTHGINVPNLEPFSGHHTTDPRLPDAGNSPSNTPPHQPNAHQAEPPQQVYCPTPGCKGKWKGSYTWFVKHFKEKHWNLHFDGADATMPWRCRRCEDKFSTDDQLTAHVWMSHMLTTPSGN
ncbi:hypothetical protein FB567DRAFT_541055 [Paraphoma chrysanthemicola]|uniref:C2H2-type domain-containing protein n=1 Tax=Paraphoma chrysanthemicola TaxID=798071 RepID=A0A8K0QUD6_9PLEO|nr:hypothetical protein FB567DRAFT_541055 [Paraphoma chrysanthemicola]